MAGGSFQELSFLVLLLLCAKPGLGKVWCIARERQALLQFKHGLVDDHGLLSSWGGEPENRNCCHWRGVRCSKRSGHVIMLHLQAPWSEDTSEYQSLRGEISRSLLELEHLNHLDLSGNDFEWGQIPPFLGSLRKLQYLNLSAAQLSESIPSQLGNLSNLLSLDLSINYDLDSGNLKWLSGLSSLRHLDLSFIDLSNVIHWSQEINQLPSLVHLNLGGCDLPPITTRSLFYVNSSGPLVFLDLSDNILISSTIYPWLFNFSTTLVHLDLSETHLNGSIPNAFANMSSLEYLDLSFNQLNGEIPNAIEDMVSLAYLDLSRNQLQGIPKSFGRSLVTLDLSSNRLQGSIPDAVGNMLSLQILSLSLNQLQGEIPKSLNNLCNLQLLELDGNNLTGQLAPDSLACTNGTLEILSLFDNRFRGSVPHLIGFSSLRELYLDHNQLNGTLPESIGQLGQLERLDISSNSLQGAISEAHLFHLSHLNSLDLSSNSLTFNLSLEWVSPFQLSLLLLASCNLGPRFPSWLHTQKQLEVLDISNSNISDVIPNWFWNLTSTIHILSISNNRIKGTLPNLSSKFGYYLDIDMSSNCFESSIPQLPSSLTRLDLSNNKFSGSISSLCTVANSYLVHLDLSNNLLSGGLPNCWPQWESLVVLILENNKFSGKIPNSLGSLQSIQTLHLRNNNLTGKLPSSLKNCTSLRFVDLGKNKLSGKIPLWIGSLPNLIVLSLRSNRFSGRICSELCQLKKIQILDLSSNNISNTIPRCLSNFTAMTTMSEKESLIIAHNYTLAKHPGHPMLPLGFSRNISFVDREVIKWKGREFEYKSILGLVRSIDLSSNKLIGEIPKEVTDLLQLVSLNLSRNNLTGLIPATIAQLKSLEVLDLSQNQLFGEIPAKLSEISCLSVLDLSDNNLSGKIPQGTQLQSFNIDSYEGNPALCGSPLLIKCQGDKREEDSPTTHRSEDNTQQDEIDLWFYVSVALGFIVGFWGVCGTLLLNNSWRYAYFQFLNKTKDWLYVITAINMARLRRSLQS